MSGSESNSIACSRLIDLKDCGDPKVTKQGKQYAVDTSKEPRVLFKDGIGNGREMRFKHNCTITITHEKILYNRDDVEIKPATIQ